jgi:3-oxoacyl-[acyl-carrier-protein] synthase II
MIGAPVCRPGGTELRSAEPLVQLGLATAKEALADARIDSQTLARRTVGIAYGTSKGGLLTFSRMIEECRSASGDKYPAIKDSENDKWLDVFPDRASSAIRQMIGGDGPTLCPIAACATGLVSCIQAADLIRRGDCDIVLAGSADASLQPAILGSFLRLGVLSNEVAHPEVACRPFDRNRSGFVVGEGAACLVLERLDSARARNAAIYAEWIDGRILTDPTSLTQLDPTGSTLRRLLADLRKASPEVPDMINLHGTATKTNDYVECSAIRHVFGSDTASIDCSSLKGGIGHLLGAAGSVELAATAISLRHQIVPPNQNLCDHDPECDINLVIGDPKRRRIEHAWKISLGFGGHIAAACLRRQTDV